MRAPLLIALMATGALRGQASTELYGTLNLMITRDTGLLPEGARPSSQETDDLWDLSVRATRIGLRLKPSMLEDWMVEGRLEADFKGAASTPSLRLRHAFFTLQESGGPWTLLAGQTDEVISPFRADSINFPAEGWPGDIGSRRPQVRASWSGTPGTPCRLMLQAAFTSMRQSTEGTATIQPEWVQVPVFEARAAIEFQLLGRGAEMGVWGHHGRKHHTAHDDLPGGTLYTHSLGFDARLPLGAAWTFTAELWRGELGDAYPSSEISTLALAHQVRSTGGWASLTFTPGPEWRFNLGYGAHDPENVGLNPGHRDRMESWFLNGFWTLRKRLELGLEASHWRSTFQGTTDPNDELRMQLSLGFSF